LGLSVAFLAMPLVVAPSAHWDDWFDRLGDRRGEYPVDPSVYVVTALGLIVVARGIILARREGRGVDAVCVASGATAFLAVATYWNPQWFLAVLIPLGAVLVPYLCGELRLDRVQGGVLVLVCAATAGDAWVAFARVDAAYHFQVPAAGLAAVVFALWMLGRVPAGPAALVVLLNVVIVHLDLSVTERTSVSVAAAIGALHLLLDLRPGGLVLPHERPEAGAPAEVAPGAAI
jgi:hypothetical protein